MSVILRKKLLKDGRSSLYLDCYQKRNRSFVFLNLYLTGEKTSDKKVLELAQQIRLEKELELVSGRFGVRQASQPIRLAKLVEQMTATQGFSTQELFKRMLYYAEEFGGKNLTVQSLNPIWVEDFKNHLLKKVKPSSTGTYLAKLKTLTRYAIRHEMISKNPCDGITVKVQESLPKFLTLDELKTMNETDCAYQSVKDAFMFGVTTGLRWGDIIGLEWTSIQDSMVLIKQQKTQKLVLIPLSRQAQSILAAQLHDCARVFTLPSRNCVRTVLRQWTKDAGVKKLISPHWSRHTFGTLLINAGADVQIISQLMGHSSLGMTLHYAKLLNPRKVEVIAQFPDLNRKE